MDPYRPPIPYGAQFNQHPPSQTHYPPYGAGPPPQQFSRPQTSTPSSYGRTPLPPQPSTLGRGGSQGVFPPPSPNQPGFAPAGVRPPPTLGQIGPSSQDAVTTLFVGGIPVNLSDAWIEKILRACGTLTRWKRVKDQSQTPKGFGFAEFADAEGVLRALRVIGGDEPLELPVMDSSGVTKKLIVKADDKTREHLNIYEASRPKTVYDEDQDKTALKAIKEYIAMMSNSPEPPDAPAPIAAPGSPTNPIMNMMNQTTEDEDLPPDLPPEQKEVITREIAFFRERAAQREREKKREEEERKQREVERRRADLSRRDRQNTDDSLSSQNDPLIKGTNPSLPRQYHQPFVKSGSGFGDNTGSGRSASEERRDSYDEIDDEEEDRRRQERRGKELEAAFREREKRLEHRETIRIRNIQRDEERDRAIAEMAIRDREIMAKKLAEWDDDLQEEKATEEYYRDRARWLARRAPIRQREAEWDERNRIRELEEIEELRRREERERQEHDTLMNGGSSEREDHIMSEANGKSAATSQVPKFNINIALKRRAPVVSTGPGGEEEEEEEESAKRKRPVLVPLDYGDLEEAGAQKTAEVATSTEDRKRHVLELVNEIPAEADELWKWNVKWEELDQTILDSKLLPFVSKKIVDLLGGPDEQLAGFVVEHVHQHKAPEILVRELEELLGVEEASVFVMKLWRMLIFETESKFRKL